jgi:K+-sensing histidine kinase KdpD
VRRADALRNRLARGDVYPAERIDTALANYFRAGNLAALRELALAWLADRVEEGLAEYRERHGIVQPWETRERVLVALTGSRDGERVVRRAARMAQRMHGDLVAVHVVPQDGLAAPSAALLRDQRKLVEEFGGTYHEVVSADAGQGLVDAARSLNATQIVMGASRRSRWQRFTRGSVIGRVIRASGTGIDVHVVSHPGLGDPSDPLVLPMRRRPATLPRRRVLLGVLLAVAGLPSVSTSDLDDDHVLALSGAAIRAEDRRVLDAFARELQASVEVGALEAEAGTVGALAAVNELRAALLSAVSHDLRTPISAIKASVTSLLQRDVEWTPSAQHEFLTTIDEETDRLNALVGNLLDMSRLQSSAHWRTCLRTRSATRRPDRRRASRPARSTASSTCESSTVARASRNQIATACSCRSNGSAIRARTREWASASPSRAASSRRRAARSKSKRHPAAG